MQAIRVQAVLIQLFLQLVCRRGLGLAGAEELFPNVLDEIEQTHSVSFIYVAVRKRVVPSGRAAHKHLAHDPDDQGKHGATDAAAHHVTGDR
ncbi:hypothetical protein D3C72_1951320 [compost metagenome]